MAQLALEATTAATSNSSSKRGKSLIPFGGVPKSRMQKHVQLLRRHGVVTEPIVPGQPIAPATFVSPSKNGWTQLLWSPQRATTEDTDVVRELDQDVAQALVAVGGTMLGIPTHELLRSPGMRKLVARNIRWFQGTPDLVKMVGLMAAKKLNQWVARRYGLELSDLPTNLKREHDSEPEPPNKKVRREEPTREEDTSPKPVATTESTTKRKGQKKSPSEITTTTTTLAMPTSDDDQSTRTPSSKTRKPIRCTLHLPPKNSPPMVDDTTTMTTHTGPTGSTETTDNQMLP